MINCNKKYSVIGIIFLAAILAAWLLWPSTHQQGLPENTNKAESNYQVYKVVKRQVTDYYKAVGTVKPTLESSLSSQIVAKVIKVLASPGDKVKAGQLLIELDSRDYKARVDRAEQGVASAEAVLSEAETSFNRIKKLVSPGYVTKQAFDVARSRYLQAASSYQQAQKLLREARVALSYCQIKAPINGKVINKFVEVGDQANPGKVLLQFQSKGALRLVANVPENLISHVKLNDKLPIKIAAKANKVQGVVTEIVPSVDPSTRSFVVKVSLPLIANVFPGMFGRLWIPVGISQVIELPKIALHRRGQLQFVYLLQNNRAVIAMVTVGRQLSANNLEILSGLNVGDDVILQGAN